MVRALIEALPVHPTREMAAASIGVPHRVVENWIRRGSVPGAPDLLATFAWGYLRAEAKHAEDLYGRAMTALFSGDVAVCREYQAIIQRRWQGGPSADLLAAAAAGPKRTDDLRGALLHPSARLLAILAETGWVRDPGWSARAPAQLTAGATAAPEDSADADG